MGNKSVSDKTGWNIKRYIGTDERESTSNICAVIATNLNIGSFPLYSFSDNLADNQGGVSFVNFIMKKYCWNGSRFHYLVLNINTTTHPR